MTAHPMRVHATSFHTRTGDPSQAALTWLIAFLCMLLAMWMLVNERINMLGFLMAMATLLVIIAINKPFGLCVTLAYLFMLGDIRRTVNSVAGFPRFDPLLLVGPLIAGVLTLPIFLRLRLRDATSKAVFAMMVVMMLEIVNPKQGPVAVGLAGAMFYVVPLLWFWIGREFGTNQLLGAVIYKLVIPVALLAAILGLWQTYIGFLPWETAWLAEVASSYAALNLGGGFIRAFGFSVNSVEYSNLLLVASVATLAAFFAGRRLYGFLFPCFAAMLFLASSRTSIVKLLFAVAAAWALSSKGGKGWTVRLPFALAVGIGLLAFALSQVSHHSSGPSTAAAYSTQHQVEGLSHPLDSKHSTAGIHATMFLGGFKKGLSYPIGYGLGAVTMGATRLGGDESAAGSSEVDISDAFISMGLVGGLLYLFTIYLVIRQALAFGRTAPKYLGLPALAILAAMGGSWIALGQYGIGPLVWFIIGVITRHNTVTAKRVRMLQGVSTYPSQAGRLPASDLSASA